MYCKENALKLAISIHCYHNNKSVKAALIIRCTYNICMTHILHPAQPGQQQLTLDNLYTRRWQGKQILTQFLVSQVNLNYFISLPEEPKSNYGFRSLGHIGILLFVCVTFNNYMCMHVDVQLHQQGGSSITAKKETTGKQGNRVVSTGNHPVANSSLLTAATLCTTRCFRYPCPATFL